MKKFLAFIILILFFQTLKSQDDFGTRYMPKYDYALYLTNSYSEFGEFYIVKIINGKIVDGSYITKHQFLLEISGNKWSEANPDKKNYLKKYGLTIRETDSLLRILWKLRYPLDPRCTFRCTDTLNHKGWAVGKYQPSKGQIEILKKYGIKESIYDPIIGENILKLLRDMKNPTWVNNYINASKL